MLRWRRYVKCLEQCYIDTLQQYAISALLAVSVADRPTCLQVENTAPSFMWRALLACVGYAAVASVADAASITAITPTKGSLKGGTLLTVTGGGFLRGGVPVRDGNGRCNWQFERWRRCVVVAWITVGLDLMSWCREHLQGTTIVYVGTTACPMVRASFLFFCRSRCHSLLVWR